MEDVPGPLPSEAGRAERAACTQMREWIASKINLLMALIERGQTTQPRLSDNLIAPPPGCLSRSTVHGDQLRRDA
ncbi:hypothetical protein O3P69_007925 [Scylla paramamosain]|uniref:Uncharacterized protein n=1 Tax=Scylla paramamosain TaxID=85552 RepID=A0AAW0T304_SCYPA